MSKKLKLIGLPPHLVESLNKHSLTSCRDVLNKSNLELMLQLKISIQSANEIINKASKACSPTPTNVLEMINQSKCNNCQLKTTLDLLDKFLGGGIRSKMITEISGPPGCGKTQFCMMLAVVFVTLNETGNKSVLYIDTESAFDAVRLMEIACSKYPDVYNSSESLCTLAERVLVYEEKNLRRLTKRLENLEEEIITHKAGLVIIDSMASPVRQDFDCDLPRNIYERNKLLSEQASSLKFLASFYDFPVIVTNQITARFKRSQAGIFPNADETRPTDEPEGGTIIALGIHWSHCINMRIILQYSPLSPDLRQLHLVKSAYAPDVMLQCSVENSGIVIRSDGEFRTSNDVSMNVNTKSGLYL